MNRSTSYRISERMLDAGINKYRRAQNNHSSPTAGSPRSLDDGLEQRDSRHSAPAMGFVSTYPPTACGIATFTSALRTAIATNRGSDDNLKVVSLVNSRLDVAAPEVMFQHITGDPHSLVLAASVLNDTDVAVIEHEYGIYGGADGEEVLDLVASLTIPCVVILHTVPASPTPNQQRILETLVSTSSESIVLSRSALTQLLSRYDVNAEKVTVVPHGAITDLASRLSSTDRPQILTWGLIGPGKGIETALKAVAGLKDLEPKPSYLIQGQTHPKVREQHGNAYFRGLIDQTHTLGLDGIVRFDNRYTDLASLQAIIRAADIVVLPYDSTEQVTSGVLVEAIAAGKPVVATEFPHAIEMLSTGAGILVPNRDPTAMADALRQLLTEPGRTAEMARVARSLGATLDWANVAESYESIVHDLIEARERQMHLVTASDRGSMAASLTKTG